MLRPRPGCRRRRGRATGGGSRLGSRKRAGERRVAHQPQPRRLRRPRSYGRQRALLGRDPVDVRQFAVHVGGAVGVRRRGSRCLLRCRGPRDGDGLHRRRPGGSRPGRLRCRCRVEELARQLAQAGLACEQVIRVHRDAEGRLDLRQEGCRHHRVEAEGGHGQIPVHLARCQAQPGGQAVHEPAFEALGGPAVRAPRGGLGRTEDRLVPPLGQEGELTRLKISAHLGTLRLAARGLGQAPRTEQGHGRDLGRVLGGHGAPHPPDQGGGVEVVARLAPHLGRHHQPLGAARLHRHGGRVGRA